MAQSQTIKIFLIEGSSTGLRTAEIMNWTGKIVAFPRNQLKEAIKQEELDQTGVYLLVGKEDESDTDPTIYIGESDDLKARLKQHNSDSPHKDFWEDTYVIVSKDSNITKAHGVFLEQKIIGLANAVKSLLIKNGNAGKIIKLPASDTSDMTEFLERCLGLLPVIGFHNLGLMNKKISTGKKTETVNFTMNYGEAIATMILSGNQFIVEKGSTARNIETRTIGNGTKKLRSDLKNKGILISKNSNCLEFTVDYVFTSVSAAAAVIAGGSQNGKIAWIEENSKMAYREWLSQQATTSQ